MTSFRSITSIKYLTLIVSCVLFLWGLKVYLDNGDIDLEYRERFDNIYIAGESNEEDLLKFFDIKLGHYKDIVKSLADIQKGIVVITIIAILIIFFGIEKLTLFGYTIPDNLAFIAIFFGGQYLWANFGLTLNALIENRLSLHSYIDELEVLKGGIEYRNSLRHVLSDSMLGDNWFSHYFDIYKGRKPDEYQKFTTEAIGWLGLYGIYALILGIFKFSIISSTLEFIKRKEKAIPKFIRILMPVFLFLMILICTLTFAFKIEYCIIWLSSIWLVLTIALFFWDKLDKSKLPKYRKANN